MFVPAEDSRLAKIGNTNADAHIIDLEDSIAQKDKDLALERTVRFLGNCGLSNLFVRINRSRYKIELDALKQFSVGFMLPKIESESDYGDAEEILLEHRAIALIESAPALINSNRIAAIPWVTAVAFGAEDFTAATNISNDTESLFVPKSMLALAAKANHKKVYDTPCFRVHDEDALSSELQQAIKLGYDGKLAIHPSQTETINRAFRLIDSDYIRYVIDVYESSGNAVCVIDGRVYEKLHIDRLRNVLAIEQESAERG